MSRVRTGHNPDDWKPEGPATPYSPQRHLSGSLVVAGPAPTVVMGFWRHNGKKTPEQVAALKRQYIGHTAGKR